MSNTALPTPIIAHLTQHNIAQLAPAWLQIAPQTDEIIAVGGSWQHYHHTTPQVGSHASELFEILMGMLPITESFDLPQIQLQETTYTDITAIHGQAADWLLFCDVTRNTLQLQQYQQTSNELVLLKSQLQQTLKRYVGHEVVERITNGTMQLEAAGERKNITTLFVDIRGFTPFNESHDAQVVMQTLNDYMDCMLPPLMNTAGMVDKIMGDGVMAVFGVLPSANHSSVDALQAATAMIQQVHLCNKIRKNKGLEQLGIGVGIATGEAVLGILGSHERRTFTAIGRHVNVAARLESNARVGEILIDTKTYTSLNQPEAFTPVTLGLKGIGQTDVFSSTLPCLEADE